MAGIPQDIGIPTVAPGPLPNDYQEIRATPQAFGSDVGEATETVGAQLTKTGDFFGQVAADNASNEFQDATTKLLHGDPTKMVPGADGQMHPDTGYLGLKGRAALDAAPQVQNQIDAVMKQIRGKLQTPQQQLQFDNFSRRYRSYMMGQIGTHADSQANVWYGAVNKASADLATNHVANNADSDTEYLNGREDLRQAYVKQAQLDGGGDQLINDAIRKADAQAVKARVGALSVKDPVRAQAFLDQNKDLVGVDYDNLTNALRQRVNHQVGVTAADRAVQDASSGARPAPGAANAVSPVTSAILNQELSDRVSVDGAVGPAQIMPATFARYAKPGESIDNPADNRAVAERILASYEAKYPNDPARVAVAYFSGEGNVAPAGSPTPWIRDTQDGNSKTVSSYVSDIEKRVSGQNPIGTLRANAYQRAMELTKDNPEAQRIALARINQQYSAAEIAADMTAKAQKEANDQAANKYVSAIIEKKATPDTLHAIANDPALNFETKENLQKAFLANQSEADKATTSYGSGFWKAYQDVTSGPDNPSHIGSITPLLQRAGPNGDLTLAGVGALARVMGEIKTPEGARKSELTKTLFTVAQQKISQKSPGVTFGGDPEGATQFAKFQNAALAEVEKEAAAGEPLEKIFDPESKTGVYALMKNYIRPRSEWVAKNAGPPDLDSFNGIYQAVLTGQMTKAQGRALAIKKGFIRATPEAAPPVLVR